MYHFTLTSAVKFEVVYMKSVLSMFDLFTCGFSPVLVPDLEKDCLKYILLLFLK